MPGDLTAVPQSDWKRPAGRPSWPLEERSIISQPQCRICHQAGTGQATLEVIGNGSKRSYTLNWCKPNNDDDLICAVTLA